MRIDQRQEAFEVGRFGIEVERFLSSEVGRYLITKAEQDREKAIAEFSLADPHNATEIVRLQSEMATPDKVAKWLADAVLAGRVAHDQLRKGDAENQGF